MKRKETEIEEEEEGVQPEMVIYGSKHGDGSIYRLEGHELHRLYRLNDTRESKSCVILGLYLLFPLGGILLIMSANFIYLIAAV